MSRFRPALIGGVVIGLLSSIPIVSIGNVCCCLWVVLGGLLTTYLDQQRRPEPIETADAVLGGLVAGLIGSVISCAISAAIFAATGALVQESIRNAIEGNSQIPPEWRDRIVGFTAHGGMMVIIFAITVPVYAIFAMLGALLGVAFFKKKTPPPA